MPFFSSTKTPKGQKKKHHRYSHGESMKQMLRDELRQDAARAGAVTPHTMTDRHAEEAQCKAEREKIHKKNWITHGDLEDRGRRYNAVDLDSNGRLSRSRFMRRSFWYT